MTGHFTSYETRTNHELATRGPLSVDTVAYPSYTTISAHRPADLHHGGISRAIWGGFKG